MRLTERDARRLFASANVARLATVGEGGLPHLVVTTFAVDGDRIYMAVDEKPKTTRDLKRVRNIQAHPAVALLADHYEADWATLWWVRADGSAEILAALEDTAGPIGMLVARYPQYRTATPLGPVIAVSVQRWSGWTAR